jgi:uncharacterized protein YdaU (DUF1376 family)
LNHYPRHLGDYIRDTVGLTMLEDGAYTRLLDQYYVRESPLPSDKQTLYRIARATSKTERQAVDSVLGQFFVKAQDGWRQKRADLELQAQSERSESARESAKRRWRERNAKADANAMPTQCEGTCGIDAESMLASSQKPVAKDLKQDQEQSRAGATPPTKPKRVSRLPVDWSLPMIWRDWALCERPDWAEADAIRISLIFRDHWIGKGEARADWLATWRSWVRRERQAMKPNGQPTLAERRAANIADICGRTKIERTINADAMGGTPLRPTLSDLRQPDDDDVGRLSQG